jgi:ppGpp synthetase/RelA/SpoT-type nucleotidyltranferase
MTKELSKTQIDRLGNRLKGGNITEDDLRLLDQYRRSFADAYETVVGTIRDKLGLEPTGRPAKSTTSIADKLKRESIRLTQIQDIAGCRLIVADIAEQESVIQSLTDLFQQAAIIDRREKPSHGYRAVHVVVNYGDKLIEIQVRTSLQHVWAELSEKYSDVIDPSIKYGGGNAGIQELLQDTSEAIAGEELNERTLLDILASASDPLSDELTHKIDDINKRLKEQRLNFYKTLIRLVDRVSKLKDEGQ